MRTQVCIIGGGPSGLLLARLLSLSGVSVVVIERQTRAYVLSRIRAGVLEWGAVEMMRQAKAAARMDAQGFPHDGCTIALGGKEMRIDFAKLTGQRVMVYGQTEVTHDLYDALDAGGVEILHEVSDVEIHDIDGNSPYVNFKHGGSAMRIDCDFVAGCDGFHGVSRGTIPRAVHKEYEKVYPFGWLGILSETPPVSHELIYSGGERGFALASMRNANLSRYYIQVPLGQKVEDWSDDAFWNEFRRRMPEKAADELITGPSIEKSIAPLRSFYSEPMQHGRLFLCGDAAHIVPPTGAKGLNLAFSDVKYLFDGLLQFYENGSVEQLDGYSTRATARVLQAIRFSWWMTGILHNFPGREEFEQLMGQAELVYLQGWEIGRRHLAEQYVGLPY
ncbi:4-hydroxybenzoate 3-monooxygenase [Mariluticola halotolerans]|uniref:4-hydroxybenzoate 3-monooxygenase n=1 Tax=Mariluticola halotolerans TaxID=2909283 RepID=UPI0026E38D56|nr:4-hydroxybenzoate 3-monooxygenase [Mariluticola halotolerans]UJQ94104.1 4-hydroxybenzoate 3-monooxygenase [Mariluticola halotolerans]